MVARDAPAVAVIAEDVRFPVAILFRHWLLVNMPIEPPELAFHICNAL